MRRSSLNRVIVLTAVSSVIGTTVALSGPEKKESATQLKSAQEAGWELAFADTFDRKELGENWKIVDGKWDIVDGALRGSGTLVSTKGFPGGEGFGFQRLEFEAVTDVKPFIFFPGQKAEVTVCDISSFIHAQSPEEAGKSPIRTGYFFQFGGFNNTRNKIVKSGAAMVEDKDPATVITPDKPHKIVAENDAGTLRLFVDGELVLEHEDRTPLRGNGHDRVGLYFYTACKVTEVKVYVKKLPDGLDTDMD